MTLPLPALRAFATVHAQGGVRAAARELGVAHSSVSRYLAELEAWLGVRLVEHGTGSRAIAFTAQGEALGEALQAGFRDIARAVDAVRETRSAASVTISATPSFAARWLLPRLPRLARAHPRLEVSLVVEQKVDDRQLAEVDFAIRMGQGPWPGVHAEPLMDDALYPVVGTALHGEAGQPRTPVALADMRLLHDRDPQASWDAWRRQHGPDTLDIAAGPRFASTDLVLRAAAQGQGVALARHRLAADEIASGLLVRPFASASVLLPQAYWIVRPLQRRVRPAAATVIAWLRRQAEEDAPAT